MITKQLYKAKDIRDGETYWWLVSDEGLIIFPFNKEKKADIVEKAKAYNGIYTQDITTLKAYATKPQLIAEW